MSHSLFQEKVGLIATNDSIYIENTIYVILKKYFKSKPYYVELIELMHEVCFHHHFSFSSY